MNKRTEETKVVKNALSSAGYKVLKVEHGRGTAWSWIHANVEVPKPEGCYCHTNPWGTVDRCPLCGNVWSTHYRAVNQLIEQATGRHGEYANVGVDVYLV